MAYWFEEPLLAFLRASDIVRAQACGLCVAGVNPFGSAILAQLASEPNEAWVRFGWRQYMHWFADVEQCIASGATTARTLIRAAEQNWETLESKDVFMEERSNNGAWLRPWLRAVVEFDK